VVPIEIPSNATVLNRASLWRHFFFYSGATAPSARVFSIDLLKGHILMAERFAGRIHVLHSKVRILLQDMRTGISLHKHTQDSFICYLFIKGL
jgi:hypothetical protein